MESLAFHSLEADPKVPNVYSVGTILNVAGEGHNADEVKDILGWLDCQPPSSVVFLCFGSFGGFHDNQVSALRCFVSHIHIINVLNCI